MNKLFSLIFMLAAILAAAPTSYSAGSRPPRQEKIIRVAVVKGKDQVTLSLKGYYEIYAAGEKEKILSGSNLKDAVIAPTTDGLKIADREFKVSGIKILTQEDAAVYLNDKRLRGYIGISRDSGGKLLVVNYIDVEDYLFGVLQYEVSFWWPYAALEAQAIAARTYALYQAEINAGRDYDLTNDTFSQVYGGADKERYRAKKAVIRTQSKVLTYEGKIFPAYYHATCGGHTEDSSELWNIDLPPLKGVKCGYCKNSPHYYWETEMSLEDIEKKLAAKEYKISGIIDIAPVEINNQNRIRKLKITDAKSFEEIPVNKFRLIVGPKQIRSTNFKIAIKDGKALFKGNGWGHGVGLCQWGAYFMAKDGFDAEEILNYYYPSAKIENYSPAAFSRETKGDGINTINSTNVKTE